MPDHKGHFKGIAVPRVPWHEVKVTPEEEREMDKLAKDAARVLRDMEGT